MDLITQAEDNLKKIFSYYDEIAQFNQEKVLSSFRNNKVASNHFYGTTGYGYNDVGRDMLAKLYANIFDAESAIVSPLITCGSHALTIALFGLLRPKDELLSITGKPYDTLDETIMGKGKIDNGSLKDFCIEYTQIELKDNKLDTERILKYVKKNKPKIVYIQKSRGYSWRSPLSNLEILSITSEIKNLSKDSIIMVDNCYGEFVEKIEPTQCGADIAVGSLIKNPGGGLAATGGYIVGKEKYIELIASRFTSSSLGLETGSYETGYRLFYQGLFLAPHITVQAVKGAYLIGEVMKLCGYTVFPESNEKAYDIIKSIKFNNKEELVKFVQIIQKLSPVESFVVPEPWAMPGYKNEVIMAAGTFVQGSSIELSCDSPIREPYIAYFQGGLTYEHIKIVAKELIETYSNI